MNKLCFLSNLTSIELAAWVQAIGSILAIIVAALIAIFSAWLQRRNALYLQKTEKLKEKIEIGKTLSVIATNSSKTMKHIRGQLNDRETIHKVAEGLIPCAVGELRRLDTCLSKIQILTIPYSMVSLTMILGSTVRQYKEKVEMTLKFHRKMDADMFGDFFKTTNEMNTSIEVTCKDIEAAVKHLEASK